MRYRLLGQVEVVDAAGVQVLLPAHRPAALLAALLLRLNRPVPVDYLVDVLWDELPDQPRSALQVYVSRLRTALGDTERAVIRTVEGGYSLCADPEQVDLEIFRELVRRASERADRVELLTEALALWRSEPLAGLDTSALTREMVPRLQAEYRHAQELWFEARLEQGEADALIPELTELVERHPTHERLWALLMRAQHASGQQALALETYAEVSRRLGELLGAGPGPELQQVHAELLRATEPEGQVVPRQLPLAVRTFTGRQDELNSLDNLLRGDSRVGLVIGPAGVGKTALAVSWARRIAGRFAGGVLYADLLGFAPSTEPASPRSVLPGFLAALGVSSERLPVKFEDQVALYRSVLAERSVLVVLDNARSVAQVRPLVATGQRCLTLVTSRSELAGLVAVEEAVPFRLEVLGPEQARKLLAARVGEERLEGDEASSRELIERCAGLPLALSLLAAQLALRSGWQLESFAQAIREAPLDTLATGDGTDVRTVFSWSYQQLRPDAARLFRLLGLHPGPDITMATAAALAGSPIKEVRPLLAELVAAHQLAETGPDRYAIHDLLRSYALDLCDETEARAAFDRLLDHLVRTASAAALAVAPTRDPIELLPPDPAVEALVPASKDEAFAWFDSEQANHLPVLRAAVGQADGQLWRYAWAIADYLDLRGRTGDLLAAETLALAAAIRLGDPLKEARTRRNVARAYLAVGRWNEAIEQHQRAIAIAEELGDTSGIAHGALSLGRVLARTGQDRPAIEQTSRALRIYEQTGHQSGAFYALNNIAWYHAKLGEYEQALTYGARALETGQDTESAYGRGAILDTIAYALAGLGRLDEAITSYQAAVKLYRESGRDRDTADVLVSLADAQQRAGLVADARSSWTEALEILTDLDPAAADSLRVRLAAQAG